MKKRFLVMFMITLFFVSTVSNANAAALRLGSRGSEVKRVQERLISLGYLKVRADGSFGPATRQAVVSFQRSSGMVADGYVGPATMAKLFGQAVSSTAPQVSNPSRGTAASSVQVPIKRALRQGSRGSDVVTLQRRLNELGFNSGTPDGSFGPGTKRAVMNFQRSRGLSVDGSVGPATIAKLFESAVESKPEPVPAPTPEPPTSPAPAPKPVYSGQTGALAGKIVILDPGHGGVDPGANRLGVYEKNLVIDFTLRTKRMLEEAGAIVILTRNDDTTHSLFNRSAIANNYVLNLELQKRNSELNELTKLKQQKEDLRTEAELKLNETNANLETLQAELLKNQTNLEDIKAQRVILSGKLDQAKLENKTEEVASLEAEGVALDKQITELTAIVEKNTTDIATRDQLRLALETDIEKINLEISSVGGQITAKQNEVDNIITKLNMFKEYLDMPTLDTRTGIYRFNDSTSEWEIRNSDLDSVFDLEKGYSDNIIFVSIHINSTSESETVASGIQVYYRNSAITYKDNKPYYTDYNDLKRRKLSDSLLGQLNAVSDFSYKYTSSKTADFSVLRENNLVSSLVEIGFINNSQNRDLLVQEDYREKTAFGLYNGIVEYFK